MWLTDGHRVLLLRRAGWLDHPGTWTVPGGHVKADETTLDGAAREFTEEAGYLPPHDLEGHRDVHGFRIYCARADPDEVGWNPVLNDENTDHVWADPHWLREHWHDLHPGLRTLLGNGKTAARDTIDKSWIDKVRKSWKAWAKRKTSVGYMEAEKYLDEGLKWILALSNDMAYAKGFFTFLRKDKKEQSLVYKMRIKAMEDLKKSAQYLKAGKDVIEFWDKVMTPGTNDYKMGSTHRLTLMSGAARDAGLPEPKSVEEANELAKSNPRLVEKALSKNTRSTVIESVTKADAILSRKFLAHLTRIINQYGSDIEWGSFEREFSIGNVKVVMVDLFHPFPQEAGKGHNPPAVKDYIKQLLKAEALLKQKGLGFLWYGTMFVSCKTCGGDNERGKRFGVGARYNTSNDTVTVYMEPRSSLYRLIAHELGHRYYYKFMSSTDRARFNSYFGEVPAVSEYGGTISEEDFAEVFAYYVDNRNLTRDQLERFKKFIKTKGRRAKVESSAVRPGSFKEVHKTRMRLSADGLVNLWSISPAHTWQP